MLVLDDADVDVASSAAVWGAFVNAGQACLSVERCYVHRSLYERFLAACAEKTKKLRVGHGEDRETDVGPDDSRAAVAHCRSACGRREGARGAGSGGGIAISGTGQEFLSSDGAGRCDARDANHARRNIWSGAAGDGVRQRRRSRAPGQRFRVRTGGQRVDARSQARRAVWRGAFMRARSW